MKILQIIPSLNKGGAERLVLTICNALNTIEGIEVLLVTFRNENAYPFLTQELNWKVVPSLFIPSIRGKYQKDIQALENLVNEFQPDIIHTHLFEAEMIVSQLNYSNARFFSHFHDNMHQLRLFSLKHFFKKKIWTDYLERRIVVKAYQNRKSTAISIAKDSFIYAKRVLPSTMDVQLLHNAIDLKRFQPDLTIPKENSVVMIGSLVPKKGQKLAIQIISLLQKRGIELNLFLLGEGQCNQELKDLAQKEQIARLIHFEGNVDFPEKYLQKTLIYLHTAVYEPFGLVLIEAMACGLPIVCTDGGGNSDLIEEGENGFMIKERDPEILSEKIEYLLKNEPLRKKMGENAERFAQNYGITEYINKLLSLYQSSLSR